MILQENIYPSRVRRMIMRKNYLNFSFQETPNDIALILFVCMWLRSSASFCKVKKNCYITIMAEMKIQVHLFFSRRRRRRKKVEHSTHFQALRNPLHWDIKMMSYRNTFSTSFSTLREENEKFKMSLKFEKRSETWTWPRKWKDVKLGGKLLHCK